MMFFSFVHWDFWDYLSHSVLGRRSSVNFCGVSKFYTKKFFTRFCDTPKFAQSASENFRSIARHRRRVFEVLLMTFNYTAGGRLRNFNQKLEAVECYKILIADNTKILHFPCKRNQKQRRDTSSRATWRWWDSCQGWLDILSQRVSENLLRWKMRATTKSCQDNKSLSLHVSCHSWLETKN